MQRVFALVFFLLALLWVAALLIAPGQLASGSVLAEWFYQACGMICHQRPERSFVLAGVQMPVCARCLGLYVSGAAGAIWASATLRHGVSATLPDPGTIRKLLLSAALPTGATLLVEWTGLGQPGSIGRALAAVPLGSAIGWVLVRTIDADRSGVRAEQLRYHA